MLNGRRPLFRTILPVITALLLLFPAVLPAAGERNPAPEFSLPDLSGSAHRLTDYRGKVVVLNFWATWCPECIQEIPSLSSFAKKYDSRGVVVLGVSTDRSRDAVAGFLEGRPVDYTVLHDGSSEVFRKRYRLIALPDTIIIDWQGNIADRLFGAQDFLSDEFTGRIERLLDPPRP